jgi:hypothetical protein
MLRRNQTALGTALGLAALVFLLLVGCAQSGPTWVDSGASYTTATLPNVFPKADGSKYKNVSAADTTELRHEALTALRKQGKQASEAADLITKTLPSQSQGVPIYVERASVGGQPAYVLVEVIGPSNGKLTTKRLWALSDAGAVLYVGTR